MLSQIFYVPTPPRPSARAREFATAIVRLTQEYQARNGRLDPLDLQAALRLAAAELSVGGEVAVRRQRALILVGVMGVLVAIGLSLLLVFGARQ